MRFRFTAFLLVLNIVTFALIYLLSKKAEDQTIQAGGLSGMISREAIEATRIELRGKGLDTPRILERIGSSWRIIQPIQWPANYFAINRILNQLQFLEEEASFSIDEIERTGQTLADYGLEEPWIQLSISNGDEAVELEIGNITEIGNNFYVLGPDKRNVFVISRQFIDSLLVDLNDLRNREIFNIPVFEVQALSLLINNPEAVRDGELKVRIARTNNGWMFEAPLTAEANASQVSSTINTLTASRVVEFKSLETSDPVLQGLENPVMRVTLHGNKRQQTLLIGNQVINGSDQDTPVYYARIENNPTVFTVEAETFDRLREAEEALRERSVLNFTPEKLTSIDLSEGKQTIRLQQLETGNWQVIESNTDTDIQPYRADTKIITRLIEDFQNLRASSFAVDSPTLADLDRLGFNNPRRKIRLNSQDEQIVLLLAHPENENEKLYARSDRAEYIYTVPRRTTLQMVPLNAAHYRKRTLETLPLAAQITRIKLENRLTGETVFTYSRDNLETGWAEKLTDPSVSDEEQAAVLTLLDAVRKFEVNEYLIDGYRDDYPLDQETIRPWVYQLTVEMLLPDSEDGRKETRTYVFTDRFSGALQVGASELHDVIFSIPQTTIDALYTFTKDIELPPEATNRTLPTPPVITPVPNPEPTITEEPDPPATESPEVIETEATEVMSTEDAETTTEGSETTTTESTGNTEPKIVEGAEETL